MRVEKTISGWRQTTLGNETRIRRGASPRPIDNPRWFSSDGPAWIRIADVTASVRQLLRTTQRLSSEGAMLSVSVSPGQVIMSIAATVGRPIIVGIDACIHDGFVVFDRHSRLDPGFLVHHLRQMEPYFTGQGQTGTQANINTQIVEASPLRLPSLAEQRTIAAVLDTIDDAIQKTEQIIAKLQQVKQGLLHDLLTRGIDDNGELRDPDRHPEQFQDSPLGRIPKGWDVVTLGGVLDEIEAGKSPSCPDLPADGDDWGVLKVSAVHPDGFRGSENKRVTVKQHINPVFEVRAGDLLMTRANTPELVGLTCLVEAPRPRLMLCDKTLRLVVSTAADRAFIFFASQMPFVRSQIESKATGSSGSMKNIGQQAIRNLRFPLAPLSEQKAISTRLLLAIGAQQAELKTLGTLRGVKSGLSDDLLTGRVRTTSLPEFSA